MAPRLPIPGADSGSWGQILNDFLSSVHNADGTLKENSVGPTQLQPNAVDAAVISDNSVSIEALATPVNPSSGQVLSFDGTELVWVTSSGGTIPDANGTTKGILQLTGDLAGTAASPTVPGLATKENTITPGTNGQYLRGDKTWQALDKAAVGLASVPNIDATDRSVHTGTQLASTISDFAASVQALAPGNTYTIVYNSTTLAWPARPDVATVPAGCAVYVSPASVTSPADMEILDVWRKY